MTAPSRTATGGFTLLEVLVVLALMGVVLAFAAASLRGPDPGDQVLEEAARMRALMQLASEEAVIAARSYGLRVRSDGYAFVAHSAKGWQTLQEKPLQSRALPSHMGFAHAAEAADPQGPQVLFFADGTLTPFEFELKSSASERSARLLGSVDGEIRVAHSP